MKKTWHRIWSPIAALAVLMVAVGPAAADHRGSLAVLSNPTTNINDVYAFVDPNDASVVVLAMSVNGLTPSGVNPIFGPDSLYQFKIDNTGDFIEDLVIQVVFDQPAGAAFSPLQNFTVIGPIKPPKVGGINKLAKTKDVPITGPIVNVPQTGAGAGVPVNTFTTAANGMNVFCGVRDDAFTFDEVFFRNILRGTLLAPIPPNTRSPGIDFYARHNCSTIAIEVPSALLTGSLTNGAAHPQINVWATISVSSSTKRAIKTKKGQPPVGSEKYAKTFVQRDRMAHPALATFLIDEESKRGFAEGQPQDDAALYTAQATAKIEKLQLDPTSPAAITAKTALLAMRFPDVLRLDVTSTAGFADVDNGRRPQDDVISFEFGLLTVGAITNEGIPGSDGKVGGNDVPFLTSFPFFAPPHVPTEVVPKRN